MMKGIVDKILETCLAAGVSEVVAANHHGLIFLLSNGPEQRGGIVYRDDSLKGEGIDELARAVNAALRIRGAERDLEGDQL
jgi:hypothetical protein